MSGRIERRRVKRRFRGTSLALAIVMAFLSAAAAQPTSAAAAVTSWGYLDTPDGERLRYTAIRPAEHGRFPVAMVTDYYNAGRDPNRGSPHMAALADRGFAVIGVSVRGSGCSSGVFDLFDPVWARDLYAAVEWAGTQPWSNGKVGMIGLSSAGILQLFTGAGRPPHLAALAPSGVVADLYRDVAYPGGMPMVAFLGVFTITQRYRAR